MYVGSLLSVEKPTVFFQESSRSTIELITCFLAGIFFVEEALLQDFFFFNLLRILTELGSLRILPVLQDFSCSAEEITLLGMSP